MKVETVYNCFSTVHKQLLFSKLTCSLASSLSSPASAIIPVYSKMVLTSEPQLSGRQSRSLPITWGANYHRAEFYKEFVARIN
jgi:hypothetical protein